MTTLPDPIKAYREKGALFLKKGVLKNLFFSFGSYQAEMQDPSYKESIFSFIQISKSGELRDFFCTCNDSEQGIGCPHVSALYLLIMDGMPLSEKYNKSIYRALARLFFEKEATATPQKGSISIIDPNSDVLAKVKLKTEQGTYLFEETFFSENTEGLQGLWGLSFEESALWHEEEKGEELLFEQSSWNEWGKKLSFLKALHSAKESLKTDKNGFPTSITLDFQDIRIDADITLKDLPHLIPFLEEAGGFPVLEGEGLKKADYHEESAVLALVHEPVEKSPLSLYLPGWVFLKKKGFVREEIYFPSSRIVLKRNIPEFLKKHAGEMASLLKGKVFLDVKTPLHYTLAFDKNWNLEIKGHLFKKGDLQLEASWLQDEYAYVEGKGFYRVTDKVFLSSTFTIPSADVASFVHEKRSWLSQILGFEIHPVTLESETEYVLEANGSLLFTRKSPMHQEGRTYEFGAWSYVEGMGFFPRETSSQPFFIKPNTRVTKNHIPLFIKERREELKLIKGFFKLECPIADVRLDLTPLGPDELLLKPVYQKTAAFKEKEIYFFEDVAYVKDEGFFELPPHLRLPEDYRTEKTLKQEALAHFLDEEIFKIRAFIPILDARLKKPSSLKLFISRAEKSEKSGQGMYKIKLFWGSEYDKVDFFTLWEGKNLGKRFLFTKAGLMDLKDDRFRFLSSIKKSKIDKRSGMLTLSALEFYRLDALEEMECSLLDSKEEKESEEIINQLRQFKVSDKIDLSLLKSNLRPYQQTGLEWLWFLYVHGLSGLLCDDMGLGKTHQAMALISSSIMASRTHGNEKQKILVVSPASVIHHWEDKIRDFMPSLKASIYHGLERSYEGVSESSDIVITTYGIIRRDIQLFTKTLFTLAIFDEIQIAKNKESRVHTALKKVRAMMKIGLSGTPIENNLLELKSLFDIVLPQYMPGEGEYKERFMKPIQKDHDEKAKTSLRRLIRPFVLRRKKKEVLFELPEKTEEISHCDLSKEQVELYNGMLERSREPLLRSLSDDSKDVPYFHVFALLTQLKKICNHPALFLGKSADYESHNSGKWNLFKELISEAFDSGQKVVVFTQYLGMLDIMSSYFTKKEVGFAMIKGSTKNRGEEIRRFNEDEKCRVFLGSLLAGGLGIDLIGGSIVIHYDRWWNAARENQATDRVYRIGQKRGVQVFKLVTKNTFEERIDEIIRVKGKLAEDIVTSEEAALKLFSRAELKGLLEYSRWDDLGG